ncbi:Tn3 family transposase [Salmonella enterica]|nr:Tn3 family transposase [Salmonella enterica]ECC3883445.1 Tn3 family transposase [Salmonella enterica subsp. diarizonae]EFO9812787.1 Tn3 family transposase [Salmonella enterica subsp. enterica serovar Enteritidis]EIE2751429.1 Tn3 family transposase [Salmonella enterica subsp. diarizonae serovar 48:i:z]ECJ4780238.1 Tn3 family transposase [Salmonella enterica subsp. diarizonae]
MTTRGKATGKSERLAVLSNAEQEALYGLPDFNDPQRLEFLALDESELTLACSRQGLHAQIYCILQIAYFKAKHLFFRFGWDDVKDDCNFVLSRYFHGESLPDKLPSKHERYAQRNKICALYGYQPWSSALVSQLQLQAAHIVHRDVTPGFVATELIIWLNEHKIIRPGYTTLQELVSQALSSERQRLGRILLEQLDDATITGLDKLIERDDTLSRLAILRQDARDFGWRQMVHEREKRATLEPLHRKACDLLPALNISQQNMLYYASLVNFYTVYDLRNLKPEQSHLYLLCYAWIRYRQFSDNLVDAMFFHMKQLEDESRSGAKQLMADVQEKHRRETSKIGRLLSLFVDDSVPDPTTFGEVRRRAWKIMPRETLKTTAQFMSVKPISRLALQWQVVDGMTALIRRHLRPLYLFLDLTSVVQDSPWAEALSWLKMVFSKKMTLSQRPLAECPLETLPERLRPYLLEFDEDGEPTGLNAGRYEFWLYRQIRKRFQSGEFHLNDSLRHRHLSDELVSAEEQAAVLADMNIPFLQKPVKSQLKALESELHRQWKAFNRELKQGKLKHLEYDKETQKLTWHKSVVSRHKAQKKRFYEQLPFCDITDVFRFVNEQCRFLPAMKPLQPRYAKKYADADSLMAVIVAQAMNHGHHVMARTSDISLHVLDTTYEQYLRLASLLTANNCITDAIEALPVFPLYSFDPETLYGAVDGQKFGVERPTVKARYSRKYFGRGKGMVAYTLLCNHIPINGYLIGTNEYEGHHVFDIWYRNTSEVKPTAITGDMHSINKANFAILHWFGLRFEPHFTDLNKQLKELYCTRELSAYKKCLIQPVGQINQDLIIREKSNLDRIVATLGLKEMTQGTLMRKLCTYTTTNPTRQAIFEYDRLVRSIYTLKYLRDPQLERNIRRSQNRIESYHQLRAAVSKVGGKKELSGKNDLETEISNQCGRLISNAIVYYNSAILSRLLERLEVEGNAKGIEALTRISPVAWQHILLNGHYTFHGSNEIMDLDALVAGLKLG